MNNTEDHRWDLQESDDGDLPESNQAFEHKMEVMGLAEEDVDRGIMTKVREKNRTGCAPLSDLEVTPKTDRNFWPVRECAVWFANCC
jgi:hypothetical protein